MTAACASDEDCMVDDVFCNGEERCMPGNGDARGCVTGAPPCTGMQSCIEADGLCRTVDCSTPDRDRDGADAIVCGGNDCDDDDPRVYGTAPETCDAAGLDEDCNPDTIYDASPGMNDGDRDDDGHIDRRCFNLAPGGENRGTDCDDSRPSINPDALESCNGFDDDCDGLIDEGVAGTVTRSYTQLRTCKSDHTVDLERSAGRHWGGGTTAGSYAARAIL